MKIIKNLLIATPLLAGAVTFPCLTSCTFSCSVDGKNSVTYTGDKKITTSTKSFVLTFDLKYIADGDQEFILKINDRLGESSPFTFEKSYTKYDLVLRKLSYTVTFEAASSGTTTFSVQVYGIKNGKTVWSSMITGFTLTYNQ